MSVWTSPEFDNHEQVCYFSDQDTGLRAIVAIHSTARGPAAGGTRFKTYENDEHALDDALRLSRAMSYKSALAGLPVGGGKSVIIGDPALIKSKGLLHAYGRFIDRIGQYYATGEDVGISVADIEVVNEVTPFVGGTSSGSGDPSIPTAIGVMHGLRAVIQRKQGSNNFDGIRVAVQGLGAVGWGVAERLHAAGAHLVVADIRADQTQKAADLFGADIADPDGIHKAQVDIYAPCALGGTVNETSASEIRAWAVAGSANNQLASAKSGAILAQRGIIFAPDFVINAGGIISGLEATNSMPGRSKVKFAPLEQSLAAIYDRLLEIFERGASENRPPEVAAEEMARELIGR